MWFSFKYEREESRTALVADKRPKLYWSALLRNSLDWILLPCEAERKSEHKKTGIWAMQTNNETDYKQIQKVCFNNLKMQYVADNVLITDLVKSTFSFCVFPTHHAWIFWFHAQGACEALEKVPGVGASTGLMAVQSLGQDTYPHLNSSPWCFLP